MSTALSIRKEESHRVLPVAELFAHIGRQKKLYRALADSGGLNDFFDLRKATLPAGLSSGLRNASVCRSFVYPSFRNLGFRKVNWVLAPLPPRPGACCRCCDGSLIAARKNHHALWTSCSTGWCGMDSNSTPAAKAATPWQRVGTAEAVPFPIHAAQEQCGSRAMRPKSNSAQEQFGSRAIRPKSNSAQEQFIDAPRLLGLVGGGN